MNTDRLMTHFERISDAPGAVDRLRRFILDLAVRGKLVEQDPGDEPADVLLDRIAFKKAESLSRSKTRTTAETEAAPYPLPPSWAWTQIAELGRLSPRNEADSSAVCSFVPMSLISAAYGVEASHEKRPWGEIKKGYTHIAEGDVAVAKITPCFENGKSTVFRNLTGGIGAGTTELHVVRPIETSPDYIVLFLKSPFFMENGIPLMTGTAGQKRLPGDYFAYRPFPLPPLAEQHRIVEKVDELMLLCDRLEASQAEREGRRDRLVMSSLNRLSQPTAPDEFKKDARFQLSNLSRLSTKPEHIKQIRKAILNLAVSGNLVPQDVDAISVDHTLGFTAPKKSTDLPLGWVRLTLGQIALRMDSGWSPQCENVRRTSTEQWAVLRTTSVQPLAFDFHEHKVLPHKLTPRPQYEAQEGDLLVTRAGPKNRVGVCCVVDRVEPRLMISDKLIRVHVRDGLIPHFIALALNTGESQAAMEASKSGMAVMQMNVSQDKLKAIHIPLPPLAEQKRIVAKVDELMLICDQLENQLEYQQKGRRQLLESLLHEALEGVG